MQMKFGLMCKTKRSSILRERCRQENHWSRKGRRDNPIWNWSERPCLAVSSNSRTTAADTAVASASDRTGFWWSIMSIAELPNWGWMRRRENQIRFALPFFTQPSYTFPNMRKSQFFHPVLLHLLFSYQFYPFQTNGKSLDFFLSLFL